jgi:hypothetical protein
MPHEMDVPFTVWLRVAHTHLFRVIVLNEPLEEHLSLLLEVVHLQVVNDANLVAPFLVSTEVQVASQQWLIDIGNFREPEIFLRLATVFTERFLVNTLNHFKILIG